MVTFSAYGEEGELLTGINNPAQLTVPAKQQLAKLTSETFAMAWALPRWGGFRPPVRWMT